MKKISIVGIFLVGLIGCQQHKIAFVDNVKLVNEYAEKKVIEADIKTKVDKFNKKRDSVSKAFQLEYSEAGTKSKRMSLKAQQELAQTLNEKGQFLGQQLQIEEQQIQTESQSRMDTLVKKIKDFVKDYGKQNNYTYILGANEGGSVLYGSDNQDITETVLKALNDKYAQEE